MIRKTKNKYSRRIINLIPVMRDALKNQKKVYDRFKDEYFFCSKTDNMIDTGNQRRDVRNTVLEKTGLEYREMKQTRHSFATNALS